MKLSQHVDADFHERLEEAIFSSGLDLNEICRKAEIRRNVLWAWRFNGIYPAIGTLKRFCIALNVSADWMLGISDVKELNKEVKNV